MTTEQSRHLGTTESKGVGESGSKQGGVLVKLPNGDIVNPAYVTAIEQQGRDTLVWVVMHAGYGTAAIRFAGDRRDELMALINGGAR